MVKVILILSAFCYSLLVFILCNLVLQLNTLTEFCWEGVKLHVHTLTKK